MYIVYADIIIFILNLDYYKPNKINKNVLFVIKFKFLKFIILNIKKSEQLYNSIYA